MSASTPSRILQFYLTEAYPCSYLPGLMARSQTLIPGQTVGDSVYGQLSRLGFRRSGDYIYRPHCESCQRCWPSRVPVTSFSPDRSQRRAARRLGQLTVKVRAPVFVDAHFALYCRYQQQRHADGPNEPQAPTVEEYQRFIVQSPVSSLLLEFYRDTRLVMVSLIDVLDDGLSAVYAFFEPDEPQAGYGVSNVLWLLQLAREMGLPYVYLGYYIAECRKMNYKARYRPLQVYRHGVWQALDDVGIMAGE